MRLFLSDCATWVCVFPKMPERLPWHPVISSTRGGRYPLTLSGLCLYSARVPGRELCEQTQVRSPNSLSTLSRSRSVSVPTPCFGPHGYTNPDATRQRHQSLHR